MKQCANKSVGKSATVQSPYVGGLMERGLAAQAPHGGPLGCVAGRCEAHAPPPRCIVPECYDQFGLPQMLPRCRLTGFSRRQYRSRLEMCDRFGSSQSSTCCNQLTAEMLRLCSAATVGIARGLRVPWRLQGQQRPALACHVHLPDSNAICVASKRFLYRTAHPVEEVCAAIWLGHPTP